MSRKYNDMYNIEIVSLSPSCLDGACIWYYVCYHNFSINLVKKKINLTWGKIKINYNLKWRE